MTDIEIAHSTTLAPINAFSDGGKGAVELAQLVVDTIDRHPSEPLHFAYSDSDGIEEKIEKVCKNIYGAASVSFSEKAQAQQHELEMYFGTDSSLFCYPVRIAKPNSCSLPTPSNMAVPKASTSSSAKSSSMPVRR